MSTSPHLGRCIAGWQVVDISGESMDPNMTNAATDKSATNASPRKRGFFSARFMRSLSVGVKLWSTTGLMALPLIGLAGFYIHSLSSTLWFTSTEQRGYLMFQPLDQVSQRIVRREELLATSLTRRVNVATQMKRLDEDLEIRAGRGSTSRIDDRAVQRPYGERPG